MRPYRIETEVTTSSAGPLLVLHCSTGHSCLLLSAYVSSDRGNAGTSEEMEIELCHCGTSGSGNAATITEINQGDAAPNSTAHDGATVAPTYGDEIKKAAVNQVAGWDWSPSLEERAEKAASSGACIRLLSTPSASTTYKAELIYGEIG